MSEKNFSGHMSIYIQCRSCKENYETSNCIFVDYEADEEMRNLLQLNEINRSICPHCGDINSHPGPILVLQRTKKPHLIFTVVSSAADENEENLKILFSNLKHLVGSEWKEFWTKENVQLIEHRFLPYVFKEFFECNENESIASLQLKLLIYLQANNVDLKTQIISIYPELISSNETLFALDKMILYSKILDDEGIISNQNMTSLLIRDRSTLENVIKWANRLADKEEARIKQNANGPRLSQDLEEIFQKFNLAISDEKYKKALEFCLLTYQIAKKDNNPYFIALYSGLFTPLQTKVQQNNFYNYFELYLPYLEWSADALKANAKGSLGYLLIHFNLGNMYMERKIGTRFDNVEKSIMFSLEAVDTEPNESFIETISSAYHNLGRAYEARLKGNQFENYEKAIEAFEKAQSLRDSEKDAEIIASTNNALGATYSKRVLGSRKENLEKSIDYYKSAITYYRTTKDKDTLANLLTNLSTAYTIRIKGGKAENIRIAIQCCEEAQNVHTANYPPEQKAKIFGALANAYSDRVDGEMQANIDSTITYNELALDIYMKTGNANQILHHQINLANAHCKKPNISSVEIGIGYYKEAIGNFSPETSSVFNIALAHYNLASAYINRVKGKTQFNCNESIKYCEKALEIFTYELYPYRWAMTNHVLGQAYSKLSTNGKGEEVDMAIKYFNLALTVIDLNQFTREYRMIQDSLGNLYLESDQWGFAQNAYEEAIEAGEKLFIEALNGTGLGHEIGSNSSIYANLSYCQARLGNFDQALLTSDIGKTRNLVEAIDMNSAMLQILPTKIKDELNSVQLRVKDLQYKLQLLSSTEENELINATKSELFENQTKYSEIKQRIKNDFPELFSSKIELSDFLDVIPKGGAVVILVLTRRGTLIFILTEGYNKITQENIIWSDRFTQKSLVTLLNGRTTGDKSLGWFTAYENFKFSPKESRNKNWKDWIKTFDSTTRKLWNDLFSTIHKNLQSKALNEGGELIIIPQGGLGILPLHAAYREQNKKRRYLMEDYTIIYSPSVQVFKKCLGRSEKSRSHSNSILAVINPSNELKHAGLEWDGIKKYFEEAPNRLTLRGNEATFSQVNKAVSDKAYLHFACHGFYNWSSPEQSGLIMANNEILSLSYIKSYLDLSENKLAVLAACETGIADIFRAPDEFIGLPTGLIQAGATTVLSSLWNVDDYSTQILIEQFYKNYFEEEKTIPQSLRLAQLWLKELNYNGVKKPFSHPFYWSAFTVFGC